MRLEPELVDKGIYIFNATGLQFAGMVQLTKYLPAEDLPWLWSEYWRINKDVERIARMGHYGGLGYALFVNDITGGEFCKLEEEDES